MFSLWKQHWIDISKVDQILKKGLEILKVFYDILSNVVNYNQSKADVIDAFYHYSSILIIRFQESAFQTT